MVIEEVNEESEVNSKHLVAQFDDHHPDMVHECSNKEKGKVRLVNDEVVVDITKQISIVINNAYEHNPGWSKENKIKLTLFLMLKKMIFFKRLMRNNI